MLLREAAVEYGWNLNYGSIALMWRGGCIIRSRFLGRIKEAFDADASLSNLIFAPFFAEQVLKTKRRCGMSCKKRSPQGSPCPHSLRLWNGSMG